MSSEDSGEIVRGCWAHSGMVAMCSQWMLREGGCWWWPWQGRTAVGAVFAGRGGEKSGCGGGHFKVFYYLILKRKRKIKKIIFYLV